MSVPRGSLRTFLESAKSSLHSAILSQQRVMIVIGNESADLDSITSAIVLAYLKSNSTTTPLTNQSVNRHTPPSQYPPLYIPLLNIPKADIKIRPELLKLLPHAALEPDHLITLDDLSAVAPTGLNPSDRESLQPKLTRLLLTDHNKLAGELAPAFSDRVVGCIDHHIDEHVISPDSNTNEPHIINTQAGSCTSLVIQHCQSAWDRLTSNVPGDPGQHNEDQSKIPSTIEATSATDDTTTRHQWDAQIAKFTLASILIDTAALKDPHKTEEVDRSAVNYLEHKIRVATSDPSPGNAITGDGEGKGYDRENFYREIKEAKNDLSALTLEEIFRKDYKQWDKIDGGLSLGISSVVQPISWQIKQVASTSNNNDTSNNSDDNEGDTFNEIARKFSRDRKLDVFCIMTAATAASTPSATATTTQEKHNNDNDDEKPKFRRELWLTSCTEEADEIANSFEEKFGARLDLVPWDGNNNITSSSNGNSENSDNNNGRPIKIWWQRDVSKSRKQVAPLLREAMSNAGVAKEKGKEKL